MGERERERNAWKKVICNNAYQMDDWQRTRNTSNERQNNEATAFLEITVVNCDWNAPC